MITSERQLKAAKEKLVTLKADIAKSEAEGTPEILLEQAGSLGDQIQEEINEYLDITSNGLEHIQIDDIEDLVLMPVKYRLAQHKTLSEFSKEINVSERQVARWEKEGYRNISVPQLINIIKNLPITIVGKFAM